VAGSGLSGLELTRTATATRLRVRVRPGARENAIVGVREGALRVGVTAPPDRGKANKAVLRLLAERLGVPVSALELASGHGSRDKTVLVPLSPETILERLG